MQYQVIAAMLVILFLILYREHRNGQKKLTDAFEAKIGRLEQELHEIQDNVCAIRSKVSRSDSQRASVPTENAKAR